MTVAWEGGAGAPSGGGILGAAMDTIEDLSDPRVADYRDLKDAERRLRQGLFVVEGRILVRRLLESGRFRVRSLLVTEPALKGVRDLLDSRAAGPRLLL